jgi:hypothetical protein
MIGYQIIASLLVLRTEEWHSEIRAQVNSNIKLVQ